jgi:hypothetical protein
MQDLSHEHLRWLLRHTRSSLFNCLPPAKCGVYHVMSPILHDIDLIASYSAYVPIIHRVVADCLLKSDGINILVAGVDSEASAKELLHALKIFGRMCSVTFADCCRTPLARIERAFEGIDPYIRTAWVDLVDSTWDEGAQFDLVLADSFLKQFDCERRVNVLNQIARFVRKDSGQLVLREHCGSATNLLSYLWGRLDRMLTSGCSIGFAHSVAQQPEFRTMIDELDCYYRSTGSFYPDRGALRSDVDSSRWHVMNEYQNAGASQEIIVAMKTATSQH